MRKLFVYLLFIPTLAVVVPGCTSNNVGKAEQNGWRLGAQTYTFNHFTLVQTLDKLQSLNLRYAEVYFGQELGEGFGKEVMDFNMKPETRSKILELAKSKGVKIVACGVVVCETDKEWTDLFEFANSMGIEIITCEPTLQQLDYVENLTNKYNIDIAIHNHPKPSTYWHPDSLLSALKGRSMRMGSCADVGHWERMGINPVEALRKCGGRIKSLHFKDVAAKSPLGEEAGEFSGQHDVIWGKGVCNVDLILSELKQQNFNGVFSIEYEYNWDNSVPDVAECISYFNQEVNRLFP